MFDDLNDNIEEALDENEDLHYDYEQDEEVQQEKRQISKEGLKKYEDELNYLKVVKRAEIAEKIKEAREQGDLSENAEYDSAKEEQALIEARITEIESILKNVEIIDKKSLKKGIIGIGSKVLLYDVINDENLEYYIVGATEADSLNKKISIESPLGKELVGKKKGDHIEYTIGKIKNKFDIKKIS